MPSSISIDYEQLVAEYWDNLTTVLRGFNAAEKFEFLETWVPDDNPLTSIIEIIEAAKDGSIPQLHIQLHANTLASLDMEMLQSQAVQYGEIQFNKHEQGLTLIVVMENETTLQDIHECYRNRLKETLQNITHEGMLDAKTGYELVQYTQEDVTLVALVEPKLTLVIKATYFGELSVLQKGLLEGLCTIMENTPIQECSDHALIVLEHSLRGHTQTRPIAGIVTPSNADTAFALPLQLVRGLYRQYRRQTDCKNTENFYDQPVSATWRALSASQKKAQLQRHIDAYSPHERISVVALEGLRRVFIEFDENFLTNSKAVYIRHLEAHLKNVLEAQLELYMRPQKDMNKIRRL